MANNRQSGNLVLGGPNPSPEMQALAADISRILTQILARLAALEKRVSALE